MTHKSNIDFNDRSIKAIGEYWKKTPRSRRINSNARKHMPGGDTRSVTFFRPYPICMKNGKGCRVYDVDGNVFLDFINNFTSQILGHAHPNVVKAVRDRFAQGNCFAAPIEEAYELAEILCNRIKSVERIRFTNSGTEATMYALRAARAFTGKKKILKVEGGYHGTHDYAQVSVKPNLEEVGPSYCPKSLPEKGISDNIAKDVLVTPFNDKENTEKIIGKNKNDIAAFIVEPIMHSAGMITPINDYLKLIREITIENDILLIFDEVVTFRIAEGGAQQYYKVFPDLTCLGKMIGGGLPIGAFGGREDIMSIFSPEEKDFLKHSGTFNANAATMAAGVATMKELTLDVISKLNSLGNMLRSEIKRAFADAGIIAQVKGEASLFQVHFTDKEIRDFRTASTADKDLMMLLFLHLLNHGIFLAPRGAGNLSTAITRREVQEFISSLEDSLIEMKPYVKEFNPSLLVSY